MSTDRFGTRVGSLAAEFNKGLGTEPKTVKQLAAACGRPWDLNWPHLYTLIKRGKVRVVRLPGQRAASYVEAEGLAAEAEPQQPEVYTTLGECGVGDPLAA